MAQSPYDLRAADYSKKSATGGGGWVGVECNFLGVPRY